MSTIDHAAPTDAITLQVAYQRLTAIPELVDQNITKTAFSPLVADYKDYAVGLVDPDGRLITQAKGGLPIFVANAIGTAVRHGLSVHGADNLHTGDVVISNDAATLGQHLNNVVMYTPIRLQNSDGTEGDLFGFFAVVVHLLDVGGGVIGSIAPHSSDIWQEGIQYPSVKLWSRGEPVSDVYRILETNTRFPDQVRGDVAAQLAGCLFGRDRVSEVVEQYGYHTVRAAVEMAWSQARAKVARRVGALTDGKYSASSYLDDDGIHEGAPIEVTVSVEVSGEELTVDFSGIAPQVPSAHNAGFHGGAVAAARMAIKYLLSPEDPANEGDFLGLHVTAPEGTFLSASPGAALGCSGNILPTVVDTILRALDQAGALEVPAAHHGNYSWHIFGGKSPTNGQFWQSMASMAGGWGASDAQDGSGPFRSMCHGDTLEVPVELQEALYPLRIERMAITTDSGGAGRHRGGAGMEKTVTMLGDATLSSSMDRIAFPPWGMRGGRDGHPGGGGYVIDGVTTPFTKVSAVPLPAGATVWVRSSGGGGYGSPWLRDPAVVADDVARGFVSRESAANDYLVLIDDNGAVDPLATSKLRASRQSEDSEVQNGEFE